MIEVRPLPGRNFVDPAKYQIPECPEPSIVFLNPTFKYAIVNELMYRQRVLTPVFNVEEFADAFMQRNIDPEWEGAFIGIIPEVADWFWRLPVPLRMAPLITELWYEGGDDIFQQLWPEWDGESDEFDINAEAAELDQFPNMKRLRGASYVTPATLELARSRGWDIGDDGVELLARRAAAFERCQATPSPQRIYGYCGNCRANVDVTGTLGLSRDRCDVEVTGPCPRCGRPTSGILHRPRTTTSSGD